MWSRILGISRVLAPSRRSLIASGPANVVRHAIKAKGQAPRFFPTAHAQRAALLHTTSTRQVGFFMTPVARVLVAVGGRITRVSLVSRASPFSCEGLARETRVICSLAIAS